MKLRCMARPVSPTQKITIQMDSKWNPLFQISVDRLYVTLGISFVLAPLYWMTPLYWIKDDAGRCMPVPSCLFDIVDARPSTFWKVFKFEEAGLNALVDRLDTDERAIFRIAPDASASS